MAGGMIIAIMAANAVWSVTDAATVRLTGRDVRLVDIARLNGGSASPAGEIVVARLTAGSRLRIPRERLAALVHRAVPNFELGGDLPGTIELIAGTTPVVAPPASCFEARIPLKAGDVVSGDQLDLVACDPSRDVARIRFDERRKAAIAGQAIEAGDYVGPIAAYASGVIRRGDKLTLVSTSGPVTIRRKVTALQSPRGSQKRLFVMTDDRQILSAPLEAEPGK